MRSKILTIALSIIVVILPLVIVSILLAVRFNATLFDYTPFWNDEILHWHQSASFMEAGFNSGYYTLDENIAIAPFSHFYVWGVWVYMIYGTIGKLFGFPLYAIVIINLIFFMLSVAFFIISVRPSRLYLILTGILLATFIPLLLYMPSSMLQVLNLAIAIVFATGFYHLLSRPVGWRFVLAMTVFSVLAGLLRPTYALFLAPLFALAESERKPGTIILAGFKALPPFLIAAIGFFTAGAPYPIFRTILFLGDDPLFSKLQQFAAYIKQSFIWLTEGSAVIMAQRYQIGVLILVLIVRGAISYWQNRNQETDDSGWQWELALHLYNLIGFYVATFLFHETIGGHDYRVMAPHLLFSLILLVALRRGYLVMLMIGLAILALPSFWTEFQYKEANFTGIVKQQFADWASLTGDDLQYEPDAPSAWCNTVISSGLYFLDPAGQPGFLLSVPPGMGLSWAFDWSFPGFDLPVPDDYTIPDRFQSRYLILSDTDYDLWGQNHNLQRLERAPQGAVYLNLDADCTTDNPA